MSLSQRLGTALWGVPLLLAIFWYGGFIYQLTIVFLWLMSLFELWRMTLHRQHPLFWLALVYVTCACVALLALPHSDMPPLLVESFPFLVGLITFVWVSDTTAYLGGRLIGGVRLMPRLSPKKTWAGFIISLISTTMYGSFFLSFFLIEGEKIPVWIVLFLLVMAFFTHLGDALESAFKRWAGVKDSGSCLPGHGGMLDRVDSLYAVAILCFFLLR